MSHDLNSGPYVGILASGKSAQREPFPLSGKTGFDSLTRRGYRAVTLDTPTGDGRSRYLGVAHPS
ncbi:hypothetical protein [Streptomyces sp. NPDC006463]|uniref:hypothetical protein n=1 Tax=Streptomyces sp. NPDC006463 TaxID=3364746 RepID=UPI0036AF3656